MKKLPLFESFSNDYVKIDASKPIPDVEKISIDGLRFDLIHDQIANTQDVLNNAGDLFGDSDVTFDLQKHVDPDFDYYYIRNAAWDVVGVYMPYYGYAYVVTYVEKD